MRLFGKRAKRTALAGVTVCLAILSAGCPSPTLDLEGTRAQIDADPRVADVGEIVQFRDISKLVDETAAGWHWNLGDGSESTEQNPRHTFDAPGTYTITLMLATEANDYTTTEKNLIAVRRAEETPVTPGEERSFGGIAFVWIPPGAFPMGSDSPYYGHPDEQPVRTVRITRGFWMGKYEITQAEWLAVMRGDNPSYFRDPTGLHPVERVSWEDVQGFIERLNALELGTFRLPTEAEWEYACRAGTVTEWSFGDDPELLADYAWFYENTRLGTRPVGLLAPNPWGLYDIDGNVAEWCQDYYSSAGYSADDLVDAYCGVVSPFRAARGGHWYALEHQCRCASRHCELPSYDSNVIGFRLCRN